MKNNNPWSIKVQTPENLEFLITAVPISVS